MKAATIDRYGPPEIVEVRDVPTPEPKDGEVLIQIYAASVTSGDWRLRTATFPAGMGLLGRLAMGVFKPRNAVLGNDLSGVIVKTGNNVTRFKVGDRVIAQCGAGGGAHAEYRALPEDGAIARMPDNLDFEQAGAMGFGGGTAIHFLKKGRLKAGEKLLVNGASGSVGSALVEIGKAMGAEVTAVCSGANAEMVRALGADHVIDYTQMHYADAGRSYDVVADTVGTTTYADAKRVLNRGGRFLAILGNLGAMLGIARGDKALGHEIIGGVAEESAENLTELTRLAEAGKFTPALDLVVPLEGAVEAHRRVETGRKRGNVVLTMPALRATQSSA